MRAVLFLLTALVLTSCGSQGAFTVSSDESLPSVSADDVSGVLTITNQQRANQGLAPLEFSEHVEAGEVVVDVRDVLEPEQVPLSVAGEQEALRVGRVQREEGVALRIVVGRPRLIGFAEVDQADVVLLRVLAGLDVDQVAEILGKRPGTVRVLQHKALRRLAGRFSIEALTQ